jgi:hypothetical protein
MARVCSATSASKSWMRRPRARKLAAVAAVSGSPSTRSRSRPQVQTRRGVVRSRSRLRRGIGSGDHQRVQLALGVGGRLDGGAASGQPHRERGPIAGGPWLGELVTAQRLAGRPDRIQGVGLGAVAAGSPPGPVQLYHLFGVGLQELGQLASGGQAPTSGQQRRFQAAPAAVDGQVRARHHQGQSFQGSRPQPPIAARIITEPRAVSRSFHQASLGITGAHSLDDASDLSYKDSTGQYAVDGWRLSCKQVRPWSDWLVAGANQVAVVRGPADPQGPGDRGHRVPP